MNERFLPSGETVPAFIGNADGGLLVQIEDMQGRVIFSGEASPRHFSTGSWGWMCAGKADLPWARDQRVQVNVQLVVIGSKPDHPRGRD